MPTTIRKKVFIFRTKHPFFISSNMSVHQTSMFHKHTHFHHQKLDGNCFKLRTVLGLERRTVICVLLLTLVAFLMHFNKSIVGAHSYRLKKCKYQTNVQKHISGSLPSQVAIIHTHTFNSINFGLQSGQYDQFAYHWFL